MARIRRLRRRHLRPVGQGDGQQLHLRQQHRLLRRRRHLQPLRQADHQWKRLLRPLPLRTRLHRGHVLLGEWGILYGWGRQHLQLQMRPRSPSPEAVRPVGSRLRADPPRSRPRPGARSARLKRRAFRGIADRFLQGATHATAFLAARTDDRPVSDATSARRASRPSGSALSS